MKACTIRAKARSITHVDLAKTTVGIVIDGQALGFSDVVLLLGTAQAMERIYCSKMACIDSLQV